MVPVGFTLQPDAAFLDLLAPVIARADYYELAPETCWAPDLSPNGYAQRFWALGQRYARPFVAHGIGLSMATAARADVTRRQRWLRAVGRDHRSFGFLWYTDHLGASTLAAQALTLPLPAPMTRFAARTIGRRLAAMQVVVPDVGLENNVAYFLLGDPLDEPAFLASALGRGPRRHLLLDLHNLHVMAENHRFDPEDYLARLDLERVIEIHVSGGDRSDPAWLPHGRTLSLDSHSGPVPEPVWALLERVLPRCPKLRGVTLERMEGTVRQADVAVLDDELSRARDLVRLARRGRRRRVARPRPDVRLADASAAEHRATEAALARALRAPDPVAALRRARVSASVRRSLRSASADGLRVSALLVAQLRFSRLLRGSDHAGAWFDRDPRDFAQAFRAYHTEVAPTAFFPAGEAAAFERWRRRPKR